MTTKYLIGAYPVGYSLNMASYTALAIEQAASVGGSGVFLSSAGSVTNFGAVESGGGKDIHADGVSLAGGGEVTNGWLAANGTYSQDTTALISAPGIGVSAVATGADVANFGTILAGGNGVVLAIGEVINGAASDTAAVIEGYSGVYIPLSKGKTGTSVVTNFGLIKGASIPHAYGVVLAEGGQVDNGLSASRSALIEGYVAVDIKTAAGFVHNFGTLEGVSAYHPSVILMNGGSLTNGGGADRSALIEGASGVEIVGVGTVDNFGTIEALGAAGSYAVALTAGGGFANGSVNNSTALIEGYGGLAFEGAGTATNFGIIWSQGDAGGAGVLLLGGGDMVNGNATHTAAVIEGYWGVSVAGAGTVTNFGTIIGQGGTAVSLTSSSDELIVEAGSTFVGAVDGDRGILDLASGSGTIALAGSALTVLGSMAATKFSNFGVVRIAAGASFMVAGNNTGVLSVIGGTLTSDGTVFGNGHIAIDGGIVDMGPGFGEAVYFTGATGELELGSSRDYKGEVHGFSTTGTTSLDLLDIPFAGTTTAVYTGTATSGALTVAEGINSATIILEGNYLSSTFVLSAAPGGGTLVVDPRKPQGAPAHVLAPTRAQLFAVAMAGFGSPAGALPSGAEDLVRPQPPPALAPARTHLT